MKCVLSETAMIDTCWECISTELSGTVAVVTKTSNMHDEAHVQQKFCCTERLLPPQSTEGQTAHCSSIRHFCAVLAALFPSLYYVLSFSSACPRTLSHCSLGKWGGVTMNHSWGYEMACVCARSRTSVNSWVTVWFSRVGCETWGVGREKEEQQQHDTDSTRQRPFTLSLFLSSCPWGDAAAALDIERHY